MRTLFVVLPALLPVLCFQEAGRAPASAPSSRPAECRPAAGEVVTTDAARPGDIPAPKDTSPDDIRAMQGAKTMLDAEARLKKLMQEGKFKGVEKIVTFDEISSWPYEDGLKGMPASVKK